MGIFITEFVTAMETYGAKRLSDRQSVIHKDITVPCFEVAESVFVHSGTNSILNRGKDWTSEIRKAMKETKEEYPGKRNFHYNSICSVSGVLMIALMLENKYSKEVHENLVNETYKKIFEAKNNEIASHKAGENTLINSLYNALSSYYKVVNPFARNNDEYKLKEPCEYFSLMSEFYLSGECDFDDYFSFGYTAFNCKVKFKNEKNGYIYYVEVPIWKDRKEGRLIINNYYFSGKEDFIPTDEVINVIYEDDVNKRDIHNHCISISLHTLQMSVEDPFIKDIPFNKENVRKVVSAIKLATKKMRKKVIKYMVEKT